MTKRARKPGRIETGRQLREDRLLLMPDKITREFLLHCADAYDEAVSENKTMRSDPHSIYTLLTSGRRGEALAIAKRYNRASHLTVASDNCGPKGGAA